MNFKSYFIAAAIFSGGAFAGAGASLWKVNEDWKAWSRDLNSYPLVPEQTHALRELRRGNASQLRQTIEDASWKSISSLVQLSAKGQPPPTFAQREVKYHCTYNTEHGQGLPPSVFSERSQWCEVLLKHFAGIK